MAASVAAEVERVAAVRDVIGPDVKLRLDANGAWDESQAIETIRALEPYDIELRRAAGARRTTSRPWAACAAAVTDRRSPPTRP